MDGDGQFHFGMVEKVNDTLNDNEGRKTNNERQSNDELFHFIHPSVNEQEEMIIHNEVKRLVKRQGVQMICQHLLQMKEDEKLLLPPNPSVVYNELVRMGMPQNGGYNENTFRKYYSNR
jgi:DNA topoisomerase IB